MTKHVLSLILLSFFGNLNPIICAPLEDQIVDNLPGNEQFVVNFKQYSGYLNAGDGQMFFYWFVESQHSPSTDPVVLWLNGGPGCSSLDGFLTELGPFQAAENGATLRENVYSWNKQANVIFLESPVGVGFSYSTLDVEEEWNDDNTARHNHHALVTFFAEKFPEYRYHDFYVTGESYAGVYIPTLAQLMLDDPGNFPMFRGIAIGDGLLNYPQLVNTVIPYNYYHALVSEHTWRNLSSQCCDGNIETCNFWGYLLNKTDENCFNMTADAYSVNDFDPYFLYFTCYFTGDIQKMEPQNLHGKIAKALHQSRTRRSNDVAMNYKSQYLDLTPQIQNIIDHDVRVLIYNGDVDTICNTIGNQQFTADLGRQLLGDHKPWTYQYALPPTVGFVDYYQGIDFVTIHGSGHFVPKEKPREALQMISNFLRNTGNYSLPSDTDFCGQTVISNRWFEAKMENICGKDSLCVNSENGPECFCMNGRTGTFCNEFIQSPNIEK